MVSIKTDEQIKIMREAGRIAALAHEAIGKAIAPGISTMELARIAGKLIRGHGAHPSFKGYDNFPEDICISLNNEVIHGIPSKKRTIRDGDVVSIDIGARFKGYHGDMARTYLIGNVSDDAKRLYEITKEAFYAGMNAA
ncbi:MAG: M24 family metallopeptidase, partial [Oscillospiraceae bacterium]|nr:M24 family metallopeptidase [Oscillospiraceae bacterium]